MDSFDTIAAIATAIGEASIAVVRVSGDHAVQIVNSIFKGRKSLLQVPTHTVWFGNIISRYSKEIIDEVLVTVMKAPKTYTTEDVVEISTHGGYQVVQEVLSEVLRAGARLAEPGEFTKRAFLGGRIDLIQAEGVMELIYSQTEAAKAASLRQVEGSLTKVIRNMRGRMLQLMAHIEVTIDYPEHDEEEVTSRHVLTTATEFYVELKKLLAVAANGRILKDGLRIAIVGKPNVGKSSLLNQLTRFDRAIVTDIPGTTRDVLTEHIQIQGVPIYIMDTAGIRDSTDLVEQMGIERSRKALREADLLMLVIDSSCELSDTDRELLIEAKEYPTIVILSKSDLKEVVNINELSSYLSINQILHYSIYDSSSLNELEDMIIKTVFSETVTFRDATFIANSRHILLLESTLTHLREVLMSIQSQQTLDLVAVDLQAAWLALGELIGETPRDDLLDQIFSQFCLGK